MVDGLIVAHVGDRAGFKTIVDGAKVPIVLIDRLCDGIETDAVVLDNGRAVFDAVTYLINLGHRRVGSGMDVQRAHALVVLDHRHA